MIIVRPQPPPLIARKSPPRALREASCMPSRALPATAATAGAAGLARRQEAAREHEKRRIARALLDELGQLLSLQQLELALLEQDLGAAAAGVGTRLQTLRGRIDTALETTRRVAADLRPTVLDDLGLPPALDWFVARLRRGSGVEVRLHVHGDAALLREELVTAVFRTVQEGVAILLRHGTPGRIGIELAVGADEVRLGLCAAGGAVDLRAARRALELHGIVARARALGGRAEFAPVAGGGAALQVVLPRAATQAAA